MKQIYVIAIIAALVFAAYFMWHSKSKAKVVVEDRASLISKKANLPYHKMLTHFVKGIRISPAQGEELPTAAMIAEYETDIGWQFPESYKDFQLKYGAVYFNVDETIWPEAKTGDVMPFWATNYGFIIYGFAKDCPDWLDIKRKRAQFQEVFPDLPFFMPIHRLVAGDKTYVGFDVNGNLVTANQHENTLEPINMDFDDFVTSEFADLKDRMEKRVVYNETGEWP